MRKKRQKYLPKEKKKLVNRSIYYFTIDVSSIDNQYNNNLKNIFSKLNSISHGNILFDNNYTNNSFNTFLRLNRIEDDIVFMTYGKKETASQHSGRGEVDTQNFSLLLPEYSSDINDVYIGYCVINFYKKIGAYLSSNTTSPETCITNIINKNIPVVNINILDIGKNKQEIKKLKKDVKKIKSMTYITRNLAPTDIKTPLGNSLPIKKATVKIYFDEDYISEHDVQRTLDNFANDLNNDNALLSKYQELKFKTLSSNDFEQIIDLKKSLSTKKSVVQFQEEDLYNSQKLEFVLIEQLNKFIDDYLPTG